MYVPHFNMWNCPRLTAVEDCHVMAFCDKAPNDVGADEPCSTNYKNTPYHNVRTAIIVFLARSTP